MKKLMMALLAMMAVLFGTTACGASIFGQTRIKGSGNLITRTVAVGSFHTIDASRGVKVLLTDEPGDIEICADDNLIEYVRVGIDGGELKITVAPRIHAVPSEQILVRVPYNGNIRKLEASSAAKIVAKTLFTGRTPITKEPVLYVITNATDEGKNYVKQLIHYLYSDELKQTE